MVAGSSPARGAIFFKNIGVIGDQRGRRSQPSVCAVYVQFGQRPLGSLLNRATRRAALSRRRLVALIRQGAMVPS
jgi:hypothetical protein